MYDLLNQAVALSHMLEDAAMSPTTHTMPAATVASYGAVLGALVGKAQAIVALVDSPAYLLLPSDCLEARQYMRRATA